MSGAGLPKNSAVILKDPTKGIYESDCQIIFSWMLIKYKEQQMIYHFLLNAKSEFIGDVLS